jgi:hypothetical protein
MAWASQWPSAVKHRLHQRRWKQRAAQEHRRLERMRSRWIRDHELPVWSPYRIRKEREKELAMGRKRKTK